MSDYEQVDEVVTHGAKPAGGRISRNVVNESIVLGDRDAKADRGDSVVDDAVTLNGRPGRALKASTTKLLQNIDKHGTVEEPEAAEGEGVPVVEPEAPAATEIPAPTPEAPDPTAELRTTSERLAAKNRELVAENEKLRGAGARRGEPSAREKALDEIERTYLDDPIVAIRRLQALALGIEDHTSKDIDAELSGLIQDLTARELGVQLDDSTQAKRDAARTRQAWEREKRERKAEADAASKPKEPAPDAQQAEHVQIVGNRLSSKQADGKTVGDAYPATMKAAERITGAKPEALVLKTIYEGFATGEFDPSHNNEKLIEQAASKIEAHYRNAYQALADVFGAAPSTAQPTPATDAKANQETGQGHGTRTITNASASVAPATPPAKKPEPKVEDKPKYRNEKERRAALARRHAGET